MSVRQLTKNQENAEAKFALPIVPASYFGIVLGLAGFGGTWRYASKLWALPEGVSQAIFAAAFLTWFLLVVLYVSKWVQSPEAARLELEDPIQCCFIGLIGVSTSLIAIASIPYSRPFALTLFTIGTLLTLGFAIWRTGGLWKGGRGHSSTTPVLYLPTVAGSFVTAIAAGNLGFIQFGQLIFGAGLFSWLAIESVLVQRLYVEEALREALRPTLGIQLAPPAVGALAYLSLTSGPPGFPAHALLGYAILQGCILARLVPWISKQPFAASYWSFSFGATALATAIIRMVNRGDSGFYVYAAFVAFVITNLLIFFLFGGTLWLLFKGKLLSTAAAPASRQ